MMRNIKLILSVFALAFAMSLTLNSSFIIAHMGCMGIPEEDLCNVCSWYGGNAGIITMVGSTINKVTGYGGDVNGNWEGYTAYWCTDTGPPNYYSATCLGGNAAKVSMSGGSAINITGTSFSLAGGYAYQDMTYGTDGVNGNVTFTGANSFINGYGKISWNGVTVTKASLDNLASAMIISRNSAYLNPASMSELNTLANITLDLTGLGITNPRIKKDGVLCSPPDCVRYDYSNNLVLFGVTGFSNYTTEDTPVPLNVTSLTLTTTDPIKNDTNQNLTASATATGPNANITLAYNWYRNGTLNATSLITNGLVSYYPLNNDTLDYFGANDATNNGSILIASGKVGGAYQFNGTNNYLYTSLDAQPTVMPSTTWVAWIKPTSTAGYQSILGTDDGGYDRVIESTRNGDGRFNIFNGSGTWTPASPILNQWQQIALTYTPTNIYFYLNGVQYTYGFAPSGGATVNKLGIGGLSSAGGQYFNGSIDEVMIFNRSLNASEIKQLYEGSRLGGNVLGNNTLKAKESWNVGVVAYDYLSNGSELISNNVTIFSTPPKASTFSIVLGTTNFSDIASPNLSAVANISLTNANGKIQFNSTQLVDTGGQDYDNNVKIGAGFISVNSAALDPSFNVPTNITINNVFYCPTFSLYYGNGVYSTKQQITSQLHVCNGTTNPACTNIVCDNITSILTFAASHFTGYAAGYNSNLVIYDSNDTGSTIEIGQNANFYASYTNTTSGAPINGSNVTCQIKFMILANWTQTQNMTFNALSGLYEYTKPFSNYGTYTWDVLCNDTTGAYASLEATDTIVINGLAPWVPGGAGSGNTGGGGAGGNKGNVNATLPNIIMINLTVPMIDFGNMTPGEQKVNLTGIQIQNDGTLRINVDVGGTDLWTSTNHTFPGDNYLFKIGDAGEGGPEVGTFDSASLMNWTQMSTTQQLAIYNLNILEAHDLAAIQVNLTVPFGEGAGLKVSTVTLTAYSV